MVVRSAGAQGVDLAQQFLKTRFKLACPKCGARLGRSHSFCPKCGDKVEEAVAREQAQHRMRTLPLDKDTLDMMQDYIKLGGPIKRADKALIFGISRHRAWQIIGSHVSFNSTAKYRKVAGEELRDWYQKLWQPEKINKGKTS